VSRVLVTGCGSGIGRAVALELTRQGHEVIATARSGNSIADLAVAERYEMDITDNDQVLDVTGRLGPVDVLINNAGAGLHGPLEAVPMEAIETVYNTNVLGTLRVTKALLPAFRSRGNGTVCFVSSPAGKATRPLTGIYGGSKAAVELQMESLSFELEDTGGRVIIFSPGAVSSGFPARRTTYTSELEPYRTIGELWLKVRGASHQSHVSTPEQVASAIARILASERRPFSRHGIGDEAVALLAQRADCDDDTYRERVWARLRQP
jgi:NADP-dependent 3-hydroxy acid dehydrogenase YdfG